MSRWTLGAAAAALVAAGCVDRGEPLPAAPQFHSITPGTTCDFAAVGHLANHYFSPPTQQQVADSVAQIAAAGAYSSGAKTTGFNLLGIMAAAVLNGTAGDPAIGSGLANHLILCMFNPASEAASYPATFPEDFTVALTGALHGAFQVRGGSSDPTGPVFSRPESAPFSGIAPMVGQPWPAVRTLFYGRPGSTATTYDWKVVPRNASYSPPLIVGVCLDPFAPGNGTSMLHESGVGLLTFADAWFIDPASCSSTALVGPSGPVMLASRLFGVGLALVLPEPLSASSTLSPGGLGGAAGGIGSEFGSSNVPNMTLTFTVQPPATVSVGQQFVVQVRATDAITGATAGGVRITIMAINNNGTPKLLLGGGPQTTNNSGLATFTLSFDSGSTGGYRLVATGTVDGRPEIVVGETISTKVNAKPAK